MDLEIADSIIALQVLDSAATAMVEGLPGADGAYASALDRAMLLDAWDSDRRVGVALEGPSACTDRG